jgi:hypothetical protein
VVVEEGGFLFEPRGIVHALWNPTDADAIVIEIISPAGFQGLSEEAGALRTGGGLAVVQEIAARDGRTPHPELIEELSELHGVSL